jgi:protein-disulfide isomerase
VPGLQAHGGRQRLGIEASASPAPPADLPAHRLPRRQPREGQRRQRTPNSSHRAIAAWGCAIDAGKTTEYHNVVFANQPTKEGTGYTQQTLLDFGTQAGITGDAFTTFSQCVNDQKYLEWSVNATQEMATAGVTSTPTAFLAGQKLDNAVLADKAKLDEAVAAATK